MEFADRFVVRGERKKGIKDDSKVFSWSNWCCVQGKLEGASLGFKIKNLVVCVEFVMLTRYPGIGS